jgi:type I restriction enzyme S subunit
MSFQRYPKYKASGVEWLGEVPEGWEVKPLRSVFKFSKGLTITKENLQDEGVHCVNYGEIHSKYGFRLNPIIHPLKCVDSEYLLTNPDALIRDGDFVFADTSEDLDGSGNFTHLRSEKPIFAGYHTIIGRPRKDTNPLLLAYQIDSSAFRSQIQKQVKGVKVFSISQGILKATKCLLPPLPVQKAIAEFLDRETGKIDELVAEQRRLMELLKEKRQAVISHAVTKGLDPNAPMKPSGIEWLGDVPERWVTCALKRLVRMQSGEAITAENITENGTYPVYGGNGLRGFTSAFTHDGTFVLIGRQGALCGNINYAHAKFWASEHAVVATPTKPLDAFWLGEMLRTMNLNQYSIAAAQPGLSVELVGRLGIPVPPLSEQQEIAAYITRETAKFDNLTAEAQRAIDLLQERRTALISAAVTGQIDVRNQSPEN